MAGKRPTEFTARSIEDYFPPSSASSVFFVEKRPSIS